MGQFYVAVQVSHTATDDFRRVTVTVDTGALYSVLPLAFLRVLCVKPIDQGVFTMANGEEYTGDIGEARFKIGDRERTTPVVFGQDPGTRLLGAVTLESFGLMADPTKHRLVPAPLLLVGLRGKATIQGKPLL